METRRPRRARRASLARRSLSVLVALAPLAAPIGAARADDAANAEQTAAARALGTEGVRLADSGDCAHAIDPLSRAEALHHAPTTLERLGECHVSIGKLVLGTEELNRVIHEPLAPNAPAAFTAAQDRARKAMAPALARIGKLRIHVDRPAGVEPVVKVDDDAVVTAMLDADRPTDPGPHKVSVTGPGMKTTELSITLASGQSQSVSLTLEPDPNAAAAAAPPAGIVQAPAPATASLSPAPPAETPHAEGGSKVPAIVALGVGGAGLVVGTIFGIVALGSKSTLDGECPNKTCPNASQQSDINSLNTNATISTIGFGVGIVGVGVGAALLLFSGGGSSHATARTTPQPPRATMTPYFGLGSAGVTGTF